jgi:hypothetical protein
MHNDYVQTRTLVCTMNLKTSHVTTKPLHQHDHDDKTVRQWYIEELCPCPGPVPHELGQGQASHGHSHGDDSGLMILSVYGHCMQLEIQHLRLCHSPSLSILRVRLTQPDPAEESLCSLSRYFKFQVCTVNLNIKLMMSLQTQIHLESPESLDRVYVCHIPVIWHVVSYTCHMTGIWQHLLFGLNSCLYPIEWIYGIRQRFWYIEWVITCTEFICSRVTRCQR